MWVKIGVIFLALLAVSALHYFTGIDDQSLHAIHIFFLKLYFVPIIAGALWFGLGGGLVTAMVASALYLAYVVIDPVWPVDENTNQIGEILSFATVGLASGILVNLQRGARATAERIRKNSETEKIAVVVAALSEALSARDNETHEHCGRVAEIASSFAHHLGLPAQDVRDLYLAGLLHDVGKIGIRDDVLLKPEALSSEEYKIIAEHPQIAERILAPVGFSEVTRYVAVHHENWDGSGYPEGIAAEDIPLQGRILAIADTYDALRSSRPYHLGRTDRELTAIMSDMAGAKLDKTLLSKFWVFREGAFSEES